MLLSRLYDPLDMRGMRPADWKLDIAQTARARPVAIKFDLIHIRPCIRGKKLSVSEGLISILMNGIVAIHAFVARDSVNPCECRFGADIDPAALISPPTIITAVNVNPPSDRCVHRQLSRRTERNNPLSHRAIRISEWSLANAILRGLREKSKSRETVRFVGYYYYCNYYRNYYRQQLKSLKCFLILGQLAHFQSASPMPFRGKTNSRSDRGTRAAEFIKIEPNEARSRSFIRAKRIAWELRMDADSRAIDCARHTFARSAERIDKPKRV